MWPQASQLREGVLRAKCQGSTVTGGQGMERGNDMQGDPAGARSRDGTCRGPGAGATVGRRRAPRCRPGSGPWRQPCSGLRKPGGSTRAVCLPGQSHTQHCGASCQPLDVPQMSPSPIAAPLPSQSQPQCGWGHSQHPGSVGEGHLPGPPSTHLHTSPLSAHDPDPGSELGSGPSSLGGHRVPPSLPEGPRGPAWEGALSRGSF